MSSQVRCLNMPRCSFRVMRTDGWAFSSVHGEFFLLYEKLPSGRFVMGEDDTRPPNKAGPEEPPNIPDCSIPDVANSVAAAILSLRVKHAMPSSGTVLPVQVCCVKVF